MRALLYLIRLGTVVMVLIGIILSLPPTTSLYFVLFEAAQSGDKIFPDAYVLRPYLSLALLAPLRGSSGQLMWPTALLLQGCGHWPNNSFKPNLSADAVKSA